MAETDGWDAEKMLHLYLHDYLVKKNMHATAAIFRNEAGISNSSVVIESPEGFLQEWWSLFYDAYSCRQKRYQEYYEASDQTEKLVDPSQNLCPTLPRSMINHQRPGLVPIPRDFDSNLRLLESNQINQQMPGLLPISRDFDVNLRLLETNQPMLPKSVAATSSLMQQQTNLPSHQVKREHGQGISLLRTIPINPTAPYGAQKGIVPVTAPHAAGLNESLDTALLNGWPSEVAPSYQLEFQKSNFQPEISAQGLSDTPRNLMHSFPGSSSDPILPKTETSGNKRQMMVQIKQTEEHNNPNKILQPQQTGRKKKKLSNSNSNSGLDKKLIRHKTCVKRWDFLCVFLPPSPLRGVASHLPDCWNVHMQDCTKAGENKSVKAEENKPVDDTVESFLSHADDNVDTSSMPFRSLKRRSNTPNKIEHKGFTFGEVSCLHSSKSKVLCCHFSSDGKILASAGHEKKVLIWNMETLDFVRSSECHSLLITDVRFRPNSTTFATSSFDKTVQIWDSAKPSKSLFKLVGHIEQVLSLDFHPRKVELLCSCDSNNEMRLWNINQRSCLRLSKGATKQVRFQPRLGKLLATASGNVVNVIDVEADKPLFSMKGHNGEVLSICWDPSGKYIGSISEDSARVWSVSGGECLNELRATGNKFQSCTFHPGYSQLLVIGGYQSLEIWNPTESNKTWTVEAHRGLISSLADSIHTEMVASTSHDQCVKVWK